MVDRLKGKRSGQLCQCTLRRGIGADTLEGLKAGVRANIDDGSAFVRDHRLQGLPRMKKSASRCHLQNRVPILEGHLRNRLINNASRVVYKDVDFAEAILCELNRANRGLF